MMTWTRALAVDREGGGDLRLSETEGSVSVSWLYRERKGLFKDFLPHQLGVWLCVSMSCRIQVQQTQGE